MRHAVVPDVVLPTFPRRSADGLYELNPVWSEDYRHYVLPLAVLGRKCYAELCDGISDYPEVAIGEGGFVTAPAPPPLVWPDKPMSNVVYAAPSGSAQASGTRIGPLDLATAIARSQNGANVILQDGIYVYDSHVAWGVGTQSAPPVVIYGEGRPIITRSDGNAPNVRAGHNVTLCGVWLGGVTRSAMTTILHGSDMRMLGCTIFGYLDNGVNEGVAKRNVYHGNRFVNNGSGSFYHSLYINDADRVPGGGATIERNIFVGGDCYHIHLWHKPRYSTVRDNFSGGAQSSMVIDGVGHVVERNILWSAARRDALFLQRDATYIFRRNVLGPTLFVPFGSDVTPQERRVITDNITVGGRLIGTNCQLWTLADVEAHLGREAITIDAAISNLEESFGQPIPNIYADTTIEENFSVLCGAIQANGSD